MKESDKIGILLLLITTAFSIFVTEFLIEDWKGLVIIVLMFIYIPFTQWVIKKQREVLKKEKRK